MIAPEKPSVHLEENVQAAGVRVSEHDFAALR